MNLKMFQNLTAFFKKSGKQNLKKTNKKRGVAPCVQPLRFAQQCISDKKYLIRFSHSKGAKICNDLKDAINPHKVTLTQQLQSCQTEGLGSNKLITADLMICLLLNCDISNFQSQPNIRALQTKSLVQPAHWLYLKMYLPNYSCKSLKCRKVMKDIKKHQNI